MSRIQSDGDLCEIGGFHVVVCGTRLAVGAPNRMAARSTALLLTFAAALAFQACSDATTQADEGLLTEIEPDCLVCLESLTECTSTVKNEQQFVECRDVFQACQEKMSLGPDECGRPSNEVACELCRERSASCEQGNCEIEFSVCKDVLDVALARRLPRRPRPTAGGCAACYQALAAERRAAITAALHEDLLQLPQRQHDRAGSTAPTPRPSKSALPARASSICATPAAAPMRRRLHRLQQHPRRRLRDKRRRRRRRRHRRASDLRPRRLRDRRRDGPALRCCVAAVASDTYCCDVAYDEYCLAEAQATAPAVARRKSLRARSLRSRGDLDPAATTASRRCARKTATSCNTEWDDLCVFARRGKLLAQLRVACLRFTSACARPPRRAEPLHPRIEHLLPLPGGRHRGEGVQRGRRPSANPRLRRSDHRSRRAKQQASAVALPERVCRSTAPAVTATSARAFSSSGAIAPSTARRSPIASFSSPSACPLPATTVCRPVCESAIDCEPFGAPQTCAASLRGGRQIGRHRVRQLVVRSTRSCPTRATRPLRARRLQPGLRPSSHVCTAEGLCADGCSAASIARERNMQLRRSTLGAWQLSGLWLGSHELWTSLTLTVCLLGARSAPAP